MGACAWVLGEYSADMEKPAEADGQRRSVGGVRRASWAGIMGHLVIGKWGGGVEGHCGMLLFSFLGGGALFFLGVGGVGWLVQS